jgi:hypothetical protein
MKKHTGGLWKLELQQGEETQYEHGKSFLILAGKTLFSIGEIGGPSNKEDFEEMQANAELMVAAPELLVERDRLKEVTAGLVESLEAIEARIKGVWDHPALMKFGPMFSDGTEDVARISRFALDVASLKMAGGVAVDATPENQINTDLMEALSQLIDRLDHHGDIDSVREEGPIDDARAVLERVQAFGASASSVKSFPKPSGC